MSKPLDLAFKSALDIGPTLPFHFDATFFKPAHFPSSDMKWESGRRWQTMLWEGQKLGLILENAGTAKRPEVRVRVFSKGKLTPEFLESLKKEIIWRFNLDLDLAGFYRMAAKDKLLGPIVQKFKGLRPMHHGLHDAKSFLTKTGKKSWCRSTKCLNILTGGGSGKTWPCIMFGKIFGGRGETNICHG